MKLFSLLLLSILVLFGCQDRSQSKTCPDGFSLVNNECVCEGLNINGYCVSRCLPEDQNYIDNGEYGLFYNEEEWCPEFLTLPRPMLIRLEAKFTNLNHAPDVIYGVEEGAYGLPLKPYWISRDSFASDTLLCMFSGLRSDGGFVEVNPKSTPQFNTKISNGETLYLRCYIKILHERLLRIHFTWENSNDEIRETCTRIFHK